SHLASRALPRLRKYCRDRYGIDFLAVGVDDDDVDSSGGQAGAAAVSQPTASLPSTISEAEFVRTRAALAAESEAAAGWLDSCYRRDDNSVKAPEWLLQSAEQVQLPKRQWLDLENRLSAALRRVAASLQRQQRAAPVAAVDDPTGRLDIEIDVRQLAGWSPDCASSPESLDTLTRDYVNAVTQLIDGRLRHQSEIPTADPLLAEVLQHAAACARYLTNFRGREAELAAVRRYLAGPADNCEARCRLPLIVHGPSGSGKTSVMARAAASAVAWAAEEEAVPDDPDRDADAVAGTATREPPQPPLVLLRFLGTSPESSGIRRTLRSLTVQLADLLAQEEAAGQPAAPPPHSFNELVTAFNSLLERLGQRRRVLLFLDSLDQLDGSDGAFHLGWLRTPLPPGVRMVLSALPDQRAGILAACRSRFPDPASYVAVEPAGVPLCREILGSLLSQRGRRLTEQQWAAVDAALAGCSLPIFATLLASRAAAWRSFHRPNPLSLRSTVREAVCHVFDQLVATHGCVLTRHSLAYITASRNGLTESELEDLLSLDDEVLAEVIDTYPRTGALRFPSIRWTKLRQAIGSHLADREADGARVLNWYHRQFKEAAEAYFLGDADFARRVHSDMADYFLGVWAGRKKPYRYPLRCRVVQGLPEQSAEDRLSPGQPYVLRWLSAGQQSRPQPDEQWNLRRLSELPWHLALADRRDDFYRCTAFDLDFLFYKLRASGRQQLLTDLELPLHCWGAGMDAEAQLVYNAVRMAAQSLACDPTSLAVDLLGRLLGFVRPERPRLAALLRDCRVSRRALGRCCLLPRTQCFDSGSGPLQASFDLGLAMGIAMPGGRLLCFSLVSNDVTWYDLQGNELKRIACQHNLFLSMKYLSLTPISEGCVVHVTSTRTSDADAVQENAPDSSAAAPAAERTFELLRVDLETGSVSVLHTFDKDLRLSCDCVESVTETHLLCASNKSDATGTAVWRLYSVTEAAFVPLVEGKRELECRIGAQNFHTGRRLLAIAFDADDGCELPVDWRVAALLIDANLRLVYLAEGRRCRLALAVAELAPADDLDGRCQLRVVHAQQVGAASPSSGGVRYSQNFCSPDRDRLAFLMSTRFASDFCSRGLIWHVTERRAVWLRIPDDMADYRDCVRNFGDGVQAKFSEDGRLLLTSARRALLMAWSAQDGALLRVLRLGSAEAFLSGQPPGTDYFIVCHFPDESAGHEDRMFIMAKVLDLRRLVGDEAADSDEAAKALLPAFQHREGRACVVAEPRGSSNGLVCVSDQAAHVIDLRQARVPEGVRPVDLAEDRPFCSATELDHVTVRQGHQPPSLLISRDTNLVGRLHREQQQQPPEESQAKLLHQLYGLKLQLPSESDEESCCHWHAACQLFDIDAYRLATPTLLPAAPVSTGGVDGFDLLDPQRQRVVSVRAAARPAAFRIAVLDAVSFRVARVDVGPDQLWDVGTDEQPAVFHRPDNFLARFRPALALAVGDNEVASTSSLAALLRRNWHAPGTQLAVCAALLDRAAGRLSLAVTSRVAPSERLRRTGEANEPPVLWLGRVVRANLGNGGDIGLEFGGLLDLGPAAEFLPPDGAKLLNYKLQLLDSLTGQLLASIRPASAEPLYFVRLGLTSDLQLAVGQAYSPAYRVTFAVFDDEELAEAGGGDDDSDMFAITPPRVLQVYRLSDSRCLANYMFESDPLGFCLLGEERRQLLVVTHNFPLMLMSVADEAEATEP
uniref:NACHT domain-containing protein n=1 Tax=Macrostomum lignano TaxID=282301 RepID=A0A1I8GX10_9PLAT